MSTKICLVGWNRLHPGRLLIALPLWSPFHERLRSILQPGCAGRWSLLFTLLCGFFRFGPQVFMLLSERAGRVGLVSFVMLFFGRSSSPYPNSTYCSGLAPSAGDVDLLTLIHRSLP